MCGGGGGGACVHVLKAGAKERHIIEMSISD